MNVEHISGCDAYMMYIAFKMHFSSNTYDFFKYNGKTRTSVASFNSRNDKYQFEKLSIKFSKEKIIEKMLVEQLVTPNFWVKSLMEKDNESRYLVWRGFIEGIEYSLKKEFSFIKEYCLTRHVDYNNVFAIRTGTHPLIFKFLLRNDIRIETFIALDSILHLSDSMNIKNSTDPIWSEQYRFMCKYYPFVAKHLPGSKTIKKLFKESFI